MKTLLKILGALVGLLVVVALGGFLWAKSKSAEVLARRFETHKVDFPIPFPLTETEIAELRAERTPKAPEPAPAPAPAPDPKAAKGAKPAAPAAEPVVAPPPDPLAGVDLNAIALERAIARGKHLVESRYACIECHGANFGGGIMIDSDAIGHLFGVNITSGKGGQIAKYGPSDWDRIVRHGVLPDGRPAAMPSSDFFGMSDHELSDVAAYVRSVPPVDKEVARPVLGPVGTVLIATGKLPLSAMEKKDHQAAHEKEPPASAETVEFGKHMMQVCTGCHGADLAGGPIAGGDPSWPPALNLTPHADGLKGWTFEDFSKALKEGKRKSGEPLRPPMSAMATYAGNLTPTELKAMWVYLQTVPPKPLPH